MTPENIPTLKKAPRQDASARASSDFLDRMPQNPFRLPGPE